MKHLMVALSLTIFLLFTACSSDTSDNNGGGSPSTVVIPPFTGGGTGYQDVRFGNTLSVTNSAVFAGMIRDAANGCGWYWIIGGTDYSAYTHPSYLDLHIDNVDADRVRIYLGLASSSPEYNPGHPVIQMTGIVYDTNVNTASPGVTLQADGALGTCTWNAVGNDGLNIVAASQNFSDGYMDVILKYKQQIFARAKLKSY